MGIANWLGLGKDIAEPIKAVGDLYTTDKARIEAETKYQEIIQQPVLEQQKVNAILASSANIFNSGWQPLIGWTSGFLILLYYAPQIILTTYLWYNQCVSQNKILPFPMSPSDILNLVGLVFGFGGLSLFKKKS